MYVATESVCYRYKMAWQKKLYKLFNTKKENTLNCKKNRRIHKDN